MQKMPAFSSTDFAKSTYVAQCENSLSMSVLFTDEQHTIVTEPPEGKKD